MDKDGALRKITKLLALATSSNEGEAANAKRQADALMKKFNVDQVDIQTAQIHSEELKSAGKTGIPAYECMLAESVANVFGARILFRAGKQGEIWTWKGRRKTREAGQLSFVAPSIQAKLCAYCFEALRRQMRADRRKLDAKLMPAHAEAWAIGWVVAVQPKLAALNMGYSQDAANAYIERLNPGTAKTLTKFKDGFAQAGDDALALARLGRKQGESAQLHAAVHGQEGLRKLGAS